VAGDATKGVRPGSSPGPVNERNVTDDLSSNCSDVAGWACKPDILVKAEHLCDQAARAHQGINPHSSLFLSLQELVNTMIDETIEAKRRFGWREPGTWWLAGGQIWTEEFCGRLPMEQQDHCQYCGFRLIKRFGWKWIEPRVIVDRYPCNRPPGLCVDACPFYPTRERVGLVWLPRYYSGARQWYEECQEAGPLLKIDKLPDGGVNFNDEIDGDLVYVYYRAFRPKKEQGSIVAAYKPDRLEYVVKDSDSELSIWSMAMDNIRVLRVLKAETRCKVRK
jgi:hypothetical protein